MASLLHAVTAVARRALPLQRPFAGFPQPEHASARPNRPFSRAEMTSLHPSTVVRRTDAGSAELATPAHGLSLAQRRFLTLLDSACSVDEIAQRHRCEADKLGRDLARLATLGLVACEEPAPANDPSAVNAANEPMPQTPAVRLGAPRAAKRVALLAVPLVAAAVLWFGWQQLSTSESRVGGPAHSKSKNAMSTPAQNAAAADPQPIATRVLRGDPVDKTRDGGKDARAQAKRAESRPESTVSSVPPLPVEHRAPSPVPAIDAGLTRAPLPAPAADAAPTLLPMPSPSALPAPTPVTAPAVADAADAPTRVASAAPPAPSLRAAAMQSLVPISRETPSFPREALAAGLDSGNVKARLTIGTNGNVESVDIVSASHRSFNRVVRDALAHWRFEPGAAGRTTDVDVAFKLD